MITPAPGLKLRFQCAWYIHLEGEELNRYEWVFFYPIKVARVTLMVARRKYHSQALSDSPSAPSVEASHIWPFPSSLNSHF